MTAPARRPGRKALPPDTRRSEILAVSLTPDERHRLELAAARTGECVAVYMRSAILERERREVAAAIGDHASR